MVTEVRFGLVGTGWIGTAFTDAARTVTGVEVVAVCSRNAASAATFAQRNGIARIHSDLSGLGDDPEVDAVYLASPNAVHVAQAIAILEAGKHVLVEKPLAVTSREVESMVDASERGGRALMEAYVAPFEPNVAAVRDAIPGLGTLRRAVLVKDQYSSRYDLLKSGGLPNAFNPELGGGSLMDIGFYPVSLAVHLFGEPASVFATGVLLGSGVDGQGTVLLGYDGFEVACLHSKIAPGCIDSQIGGEDGVLTFDDCSVPTRVTLQHRSGAPGQATEPGFTRRPSRTDDLTRPQDDHHMRYEIEEFATVIRDGALESAIHPPAHSLAALRILDQARRLVGVRFPADQ